jgi:Xaa-Pro aminopeptidase
MAAEGLGAIVCFGAHRDYAPADLWYLARWSCVDEETSYVFIPAVGSTTLVTDAEWDVARAEEESWTGAVVLDRSPASSLSKLVRTHVAAGSRVGISGAAVFPAPVYLSLAADAATRDIDLVDATSLTTAQRLVKSPVEIELLRDAAQMSDLGMQAGLDAILDGASEVEVAAAAEYAMRRRGAELSFTTIMGSGPRTALTTFLPSPRRMSRGDFAVLDCGARIAGYHGDMCRTTVLGDASADQLRVLETVRRAVEAAIASARPGVTVGDVQGAARQVADDAGFGDAWWGYYMPHGAGAAQHEPPLGLDHADMVLQTGMVLCIEPGIAIAGFGGVVLEQMVHVTNDGAEVMNRIPLEVWQR